MSSYGTTRTSRRVYGLLITMFIGSIIMVDTVQGEELMQESAMSEAELARFRQYEERFAQAVTASPERQPWLGEDREAIIAVLKQNLSIRDEWIPSVVPQVVRRTEHNGFSVEHLNAQSWPGVTATAHLYIPTGESSGPRPFVLLSCGHGGGGKRAPGYQAMAYRLARMGALVLVPDNIGQGERVPMGHRDVVEVFAHGQSLQGLIVMETMGWLRWAKQDQRVDAARMAAIGNSGGGTLNVMLAALCHDDLAALSASAYPSSFAFIAAKRKKHCHCNVLPGFVGSLQMWELLGCFAPKPMFIFQGHRDHLFPRQFFERTARRLGEVYIQAQAGDMLRSEIFPGQHAWDERRRRELARFIKQTFDLPGNVEDRDPDESQRPGEVLDRWPDDAMSADDIAAMLSGRPRQTVGNLAEVFPSQPGPVADGKDLSQQIWAQFEAFLCDGSRPGD